MPAIAAVSHSAGVAWAADMPHSTRMGDAAAVQAAVAAKMTTALPQMTRRAKVRIADRHIAKIAVTMAVGIGEVIAVIEVVAAIATTSAIEAVSPING